MCRCVMCISMCYRVLFCFCCCCLMLLSYIVNLCLLVYYVSFLSRPLHFLAPWQAALNDYVKTKNEPIHMDDEENQPIVHAHGKKDSMYTIGRDMCKIMIVIPKPVFAFVFVFVLVCTHDMAL